MLVTLSEYRTLTGDNATLDADVTRALTRYQALIEAYLERQLESAVITDEPHYRTGRSTLAVNRYPLTALTAITIDGTEQDISAMTVAADDGLIYHSGILFGAPEVLVSYTGGYLVIPNDIKYAVCALAGANLSGEMDGYKPIKRETVFGVASIDYSLPAGDTPYPELGQWRAVLDRYRKPGFA